MTRALRGEMVLTVRFAESDLEGEDSYVPQILGKPVCVMPVFVWMVLSIYI